MPTRIVSAGQLVHRIQFQERGPGRNNLNEPAGGWIDFRTRRWAFVEQLAGRDFLAAGAMQQTVDTRAVIRAEAGITPSLRFVHKGVPYEILSAIPLEGGVDWIEIMAITGARDGRV